jgi:hypothetical protein
MADFEEKADGAARPPGRSWQHETVAPIISLPRCPARRCLPLI